MQKRGATQMAIAEDIYARCRVCTDKAVGVLTDILNNHALDPTAVQARRTAADIAADTTYALLCRAFITPIDREDLWLLRETAEHVWCAAEDTSLLLYRYGRQLPHTCAPIIHATIACCAAAKQVTEAFPSPDTIAQQMRVLREAQHTCHTTLHDCFTDVTTRRICQHAFCVITACEHLIAALRYAAMKNG